MSDPANYDDEPTGPEVDRVRALIRDPSMWAEPSANLEDDIVALIAAESRAQNTPVKAAVTTVLSDERTEPSMATVTELASKRRSSWLIKSLGAAAAVVALIALASFALLGLRDSSEATEVALAGTEEAPEASAVASVEDRPNGTRLILDVADLPPAPEGTFYAAWVIRDGDPTTRIGAGTFHLRGGDGSIELWAGVSTTRYQTISVTRQDEADPAGPGIVVLRGQRSG